MTQESYFTPEAHRLLEALFDVLMKAGFSDGFAHSALEAKPRLFSALAEADLTLVFDAADTPRGYLAALPAAFEGLSPQERAETVSLLRFLRRSAGTGGADRAYRRRPLPMPTRVELSRMTEAIRRDAFYAEREERRADLFSPDSDGRPGITEARLAFLERAFRIPTGRTDPAKLAAANARKLTDGGDPYAATRLMELLWEADAPDEAGHVSITYCACLAPRLYPVANRFTDLSLRALRRYCGFYPFLERDLYYGENYDALLRILLKECRASGFSPADAALCLERGGRTLSDAKIRTNRKEQTKP